MCDRVPHVLLLTDSVVTTGEQHIIKADRLGKPTSVGGLALCG